MIAFDISSMDDSKLDMERNCFREDINELKNSSFMPLNNLVIKGMKLHQGSCRSGIGEASKA